MKKDEMTKARKIALMVVGFIALLPLMILVLGVILENVTIWGFLIIGILIGAYFIPARISRKTNGRLSSDEKDKYPLNKLLYLISGTCLIILLVLMFLNSVVDLGKTLGNVLFIILGSFFIISTIAWILTDLIREDFPWGIPRVIGRLIRLILISLLVVVICYLVKEFIGICALIFVLLFCVAIIALALQILNIFAPIFYPVFAIIMPFFSILDALDIPTYEDISFFKSKDKAKIIKNGEVVKLRRIPGSDSYVDKKGNKYGKV